MTNENAIKHLEVIKGECALVGDIRALDMAISALSALSALSEQKKGEWIDISTGKGIFKDRSVKCSNCRNTLNLDGVNCGRGDANYCPNCGADMRPEPYKGE